MPNFAVIATWPFGQTAVRTALPLLRQGQPALDAALAGAQAVEDDPQVHSVGYAGLPNAAGVVQLDACVMDGRTLGCGGVAGLENVRHPAGLDGRLGQMHTGRQVGATPGREQRRGGIRQHDVSRGAGLSGDDAADHRRALGRRCDSQRRDIALGEAE